MFSLQQSSRLIIEWSQDLPSRQFPPDSIEQGDRKTARDPFLVLKNFQPKIAHLLPGYQDPVRLKTPLYTYSFVKFNNILVVPDIVTHWMSHDFTFLVLMISSPVKSAQPFRKSTAKSKGVCASVSDWWILEKISWTAINYNNLDDLFRKITMV